MDVVIDDLRFGLGDIVLRPVTATGMIQIWMVCQALMQPFSSKM